MCVLHERHDEEAEEYIASSSDQLSRIRSSDCTRTHLRGPRIPKKFGGGGGGGGGGMPPDPPRCSARKCALFTLP